MAAAAEFLADLPSRGLFSSTALFSSDPGRMPVYICDHDTSPPEEQLIQTNSTNILIRTLRLKEKKRTLKDVKSKAIPASKRSAEQNINSRSSFKRTNIGCTSSSPGEEGSRTLPTDKELETFAVERMRMFLKERAFVNKG